MATPKKIHLLVVAAKGSLGQLGEGSEKKWFSNLLTEQSIHGQVREVSGSGKKWFSKNLLTEQWIDGQVREDSGNFGWPGWWWRVEKKGGETDWRGVGYGRRDVRPDEEAGKGYSGISIWDRIVLVFLFYFFNKIFISEKAAPQSTGRIPGMPRWLILCGQFTLEYTEGYARCISFILKESPDNSQIPKDPADRPACCCRCNPLPPRSQLLISFTFKF
jgi:hypothetical protein